MDIASLLTLTLNVEMNFFHGETLGRNIVVSLDQINFERNATSAKLQGRSSGTCISWINRREIGDGQGHVLLFQFKIVIQQSIQIPVDDVHQ